MTTAARHNPPRTCRRGSNSPVDLRVQRKNFVINYQILNFLTLHFALKPSRVLSPSESTDTVSARACTVYQPDFVWFSFACRALLFAAPLFDVVFLDSCTQRCSVQPCIMSANIVFPQQPVRTCPLVSDRSRLLTRHTRSCGLVLGCPPASMLPHVPQLTTVPDQVSIIHFLLVSAAFSVHYWVLLPVFSVFLPFLWRRLEGGSCRAGTEVVAAAEAGTASTRPVLASLAVYVAAVLRIGFEWPCGVVMGIFR